MLRTVGAWHTGLDDAGVLKEVEVPPAQFLPVVRFAQPAAGWAGEVGALVGGDGQMQLMRLVVGFQPLVDHAPGWGQSEAEGEDVPACHGGAPRNQSVQCGLAPHAAPMRDRTAGCGCSTRLPPIKPGAVLAAVKKAARRYAMVCGHS